jgi:uncharacterized GH25 family protein
MNIRSRAVGALPALFATLIAVPALAHEYWLQPSTYRALTGATIEITAWVGDGFRGERNHYARARTVDLAVHTDRKLDLGAVASEGDTLFGRFRAGDGRGFLISFVSSFTTTRLDGAAFEQYLEEDGLDSVREARNTSSRTGTPVRERYRRCAKSWVGGASADVARITRPVGLPLEIVPAVDPASSEELELQVLFQGKPAPGLLVRAWRAADGVARNPASAAERNEAPVAARGRTDSNGRVRLHLAGVGEWLVSTVHMVASHEPEEADWESYWASLTFGREAPVDFPDESANELVPERVGIRSIPVMPALRPQPPAPASPSSSPAATRR